MSPTIYLFLKYQFRQSIVVMKHAFHVMSSETDAFCGTTQNVTFVTCPYAITQKWFMKSTAWSTSAFQRQAPLAHHLLSQRLDPQIPLCQNQRRISLSGFGFFSPLFSSWSSVESSCSSRKEEQGTHTTTLGRDPSGSIQMLTALT